MRRAILLLTLMGAMLLATTGVVLAQPTTKTQGTTNQQSSSAAGKAPLQEHDPSAIQGQYIVVFKDDVKDAKQAADEHANKHGFKADFVYNKALKGYAAKLSDAQLDKVRSEPNVKFVSEDRKVEVPEPELRKKASEQTYTSYTPGGSPGGTPTGVQRIAAVAGTPPSQVQQNPNVGVAVIDTGVWYGWNSVASSGYPASQNPELYMPQGYACVNNTLSGPNWSDDNSHGTHVAGTIGALNNSYGVVGVAPGTPIYPVKVLNSTGSGSWSQIICGIDWVTANGPSLGIKAANMSLGGSGSNDNNCGNSNNDALHQAICRSTSAGITYAVAAGNSSTDFSGQVPAAYPEVLTVTAIADGDGQPGGLGTSQITCRSGETDDTPASFTNYAGSSSTDQNHTIAAPGVCIYSTDANGDWMYMSGTSMATPHITGTVALCLASTITGHSCSGMTPSQIVTQLRSDANAYNTAHTTPTPYGYGFEYSPSTSTSSCNKRNKCTTTTKYYGYLTYAGGDYY